MARRPPTVISLFSGAGGLDYGFEAAGFDTRVTLEFNPEACETLRRNRRWAVLERDIFDVPSGELMEIAGVKKGDVDVLIGGPPCQPFSKSGYWATGDSARLSDPRASTLGAYLRVLRETLPRAFLLENVTGLAFSGKDEGLRLLLDQVQHINRKTGANYRPSYRVLRTADFGVPQQRERVFIIAQRDGKRFQFPAPTHKDPDAPLNLFEAKLPVYRTAWDALGDDEPGGDEDLRVRGKWGSLLPSIPEGQNYLWHTERGGGLPLFGWRRRFWCFLLKLAKNRPSWTIQAQPGPATGPFHWNNRRLSMRELCRLQTFPENVVILGGYQAIHKQVGNAVPSLMAEVLAREIRCQLLGLRKLSTEPKLLPQNRPDTPRPSRARPVPDEYRKLVGEHSAHPGTGLGFAAIARVSAG